MHQNPFSAWAPPLTQLGELTTLPQIPSRLGRGYLPPNSPPPQRLWHLELCASILNKQTIHCQ